MTYQAYEVYRKCSFLLIESIPEHWVEQKIKFQLEDCIAGGTPDSGNKDYWEESGEGVPWVSIADMTSNEIIEQTQKDISKAGIDVKNLKLVPQGSLLYSIFASLGKVAEAGVDLTTNQAILALIPRNTLDNKYFRYWLKSIENYLMYFSTSNTQNNLNSEKVLNLPLFFPSRCEQQKIANFLDHETAKIDTLIEKQQQLIKLLKEKRQAVISHAVTKGLNPRTPMRDSDVEWLGEVPVHWEVLKLQRVLYSIEQGSSPVASNKSPETFEAGVLKISSVKSGFFYETQAKTLNEKDYDFRFKIHCNDLLVTRGNTPELVADACVVDVEPTSRLMMSDLIYRLNAKQNIKEKFLCYWLLSSYGRLQIQKDARGSSMTMAKVSQGHIKSWLITLPPIEEQILIIESLECMESKLKRLLSKCQLMIESSQERRTALISATVTGKIDVRNWHAPNKESKGVKA